MTFLPILAYGADSVNAACGIRLKAWDRVGEHCRRLSQMNQFKIEPLLLMQASLAGGGTTAHTVWCSLTIQRFIHRELRLYEDAITGEGMHYSANIQRWTLPPKVGFSRILDEDERRVDEDEDTAAAGPGGTGSAPGAPQAKKKQGGRKSAAAAAARPVDPDTMDEDAEAEDGDDDEEAGDGAAVVGDDGPAPRPTRVSPYWCTMYGQYMLASQSHHGALCTSPRSLVRSASGKTDSWDRLPAPGIRDRPVRLVYLPHARPGFLWARNEPSIR